MKRAPDATIFAIGLLFLPGCLWAQGTGHLETVYSFQAPPNAAYPLAGLIAGADGVLYGSTYYGGASTACGPFGCGTIYELTPPATAGGSWTETLLYGFSGYPDGKQPFASPALGNRGVLYGSADGAVFELAPPASPGSAWTETTIFNFRDLPGNSGPPIGNLAVGSDGALFGATQFGGAYGKGAVFELAPPASPGGVWTLTLLYSFSGLGDGSQPDSGVTLGGGAIFGTTYKGGAGYGAVFGLGLVGGVWELKMRADLGDHPSGVALGYDAAIYVQTGSAIFRVVPPAAEGAAWTVQTIYLGGYINALSLTAGPRGALYFTTPTGGTSTACGNLSGCGTLDELIPPASSSGTWTLEALHSFTGQQGDGYWPNGGLAVTPDGVVYGTTQQGGESLFGTVFRYTPPT